MQSTHPSVTRRLAAGRMLLEGATVRAVSETLGISAQTVRQYRATVTKNGLAGLETVNIGGRPTVLDTAARDWIAAAVRGSACAHGFPTETWTNGRVREVIARQFGREYSRAYVWQLLTSLGVAQLLRRPPGPGRKPKAPGG